MAENTSLKYLMSQFASNTCTREEFDQLMVLVGDMEDDEGLTEEMSRYWDKIQFNGSISPEWKERFVILQKESVRREQVAGPAVAPRRVILRKWIAAAAVVITLAGGYFVQQRNGETIRGKADVVKTKEPAVPVEPGRNRALLTLADGSVIGLDTSARGKIATQGGVKIIKGEEGEILYYSDRQKTPEAGFNTIVTPKGGKYCVVLSDGTKVWLNAASSIRFPAGFENGVREVVLTGEAFFEVTKSCGKPFHVRAGNISVEVLGTKFNINAYREEGRISTTLVQGKIRVSKPADGSSSQGLLLKPGRQANLADNGTLTVDQSPHIDEVLAWKNGVFNFVNTPVPEILREIARWYDLEIIYDGGTPDKRLTGTFSRNVGLDQLTEMLRYAGINMRIDKKRLLILRN